MAHSLAVDGHMRNLGARISGTSRVTRSLSPLYLVSDRPFWLLSAFQWSSAILFLVGVYYSGTVLARNGPSGSPGFRP